MSNQLPPWVQKLPGSKIPVLPSNGMMQGNEHTNVVPNVGGGQQPQQPNVGRWDGLGANPNNANDHHQNFMSELQGNPQFQQFMQMFQSGGQMPKGFLGFQPVENNPFQQQGGQNISGWDNAQPNVGGVYGGN